MRPKNQDRPITKVLVDQVKRLANMGYNAEKIASQVGRSKISIYNIVRLNHIKLLLNHRKP